MNKLRPYQSEALRLAFLMYGHHSHIRLYHAYRRNKHIIDRYPHMLKMFYEQAELRGRSVRYISVDEYGGFDL